MDHTMRFSVSHAESSEFRDDGLRAFFQYRDLGVRDATNGKVVAHVIRAKPGVPAQPQRHHHVVEFQMVYVLKGWIEFEYEGVGRVRLTAGSCVHQPPGIRHTELGHSDDLELIEIVLPADFATVAD
jgi:quercetin dioxygenase-like cupin family protein